VPIYEQRYRRLDEQVPLRAKRWIPIARDGLKAVFVKRVFLLLLVAAWLPAFGMLIRTYIVTRFPEGPSILPVNATMFYDLFPFQFMAALIISAYVGSGLIANDMRTGGILLYLSRPLTLLDYITGKATILLACLASVTLVPSIVLFFGARSLAPEALGGVEHFAILPKVFLFSVAIILPFSFIVLAASSLSKSARFSGLAFVFVIIGSQIASAVGWEVTRSPVAALLSIQACIQRIGAWLFDARGPRMLANLDPFAAAAVLAVVCAVCFLILRARVRAVEVVR
jgi:hypothetical protein